MLLYPCKGTSLAHSHLTVGGRALPVDQGGSSVGREEGFCAGVTVCAVAPEASEGLAAAVRAAPHSRGACVGGLRRTRGGSRSVPDLCIIILYYHVSALAYSRRRTANPRPGICVSLRGHPSHTEEPVMGSLSLWLYWQRLGQAWRHLTAVG
jgi:hypothetical protein